MMTVSAGSLALMLLGATPSTPAPTQEQQVRSVLMPVDRGSLEVFVRVFAEHDPFMTPTAVVLPGPLQRVDADPDAVITGPPVHLEGDGEGCRIYVSARHEVKTGPGVEVRLALEDGTHLTLHLVTRPSVADLVLKIRRRPLLRSEDRSSLTQERLFRCQSPEEMISAKAQLIAERSSEFVIERRVGAGFSFKQTSRISIEFVDVVHDAGISYSTLMIRNHSDQEWPVDLKRIGLLREGGDVDIISRSSTRAAIAPGKESRVVLAYVTPASPEQLFVSVHDSGSGLPSLFVMVLP